MKQDIIKTIKIVAVALLITFGVNYVHAWTGPTAAPSGSNVAAPINVAGDQIKSGALTLGGLLVSGGTVLQGSVQITGDGALNTPGANKVLTSDGSGHASWQTAAGASSSKEILLSGSVPGGSSASPRLNSIEITSAIRDKCQIDLGLNTCRLIIASALTTNSTPRFFDHIITTRKIGTKEYVYIGELAYDNSIVIGDGSVRHMDSSNWVNGCLWRNTNDGDTSDAYENFTLCERKANPTATTAQINNNNWYDSTKDDTSFWLTIDQKDAVSSYYYLYVE